MLKNGLDLRSLQFAVQSIPNNPFRRPLETILRELYGNFSTMLSSGYPRSSIPKVLVIISDGQSIFNTPDIERASKALKDLGVLVITVGVGGKTYYEKLRGAASGDIYSFWVRYEVQLPLQAPKISNAIVQGKSW